MTTETHPGETLPADEAQATPSRAPSRREWMWWSGFVALLLVPLVVSAVDLWFSVGNAFLPHSDQALIELHTRDVWHHIVTTGAYSRYGNQHPGPLLFYVLAVPYRVLGSRSVALNMTALLVNGATIVAILALAMRRGRLPMVVAAVVPVALLVHAMGSDQLRDPWNAYLPVLPLLLLLLLAWSVAVGDLWMLPVAVAVGSFAAQTHLGFALEVFGLLLIATVGALVYAYRHRATGAVRLLARSVAVSVGVGLVLWSPVLYGTFIRDDGNIQANIDLFTAGVPAAGFHTALRVLAPQWGFRPEWIFGAPSSLPSPWVGLFGVALAAAAAGVAWWRRSAELAWLVATLAVGSIAALLSVSSIVGGLADYLLRWTWVLGAALAMVVLSAAWLALPSRHRSTVLRWAAPAALLIVGLLAVLNVREVLREPGPQAQQQVEVRSLTRHVRNALPRGSGPVVFNVRDGFFEVPGVVLQLERAGIPVRITKRSAFAYAFGPPRLKSARDPRAVLTVTGGRAKGAAPGRAIAYWDVATPLHRQAIRRQIHRALASPPSPARDALVQRLRRQLRGVARLVTIYRTDPNQS